MSSIANFYRQKTKFSTYKDNFAQEELTKILLATKIKTIKLSTDCPLCQAQHKKTENLWKTNVVWLVKLYNYNEN